MRVYDMQQQAPPLAVPSMAVRMLYTLRMTARLFYFKTFVKQ
jgi:hypothetical protein